MPSETLQRIFQQTYHISNPSTNGEPFNKMQLRNKISIKKTSRPLSIFFSFPEILNFKIQLESSSYGRKHGDLTLNKTQNT